MRLILQVSQTFPVATAALGGSGTFLVYACIAAAGAVWVFYALPETTGAQISQLERIQTIKKVHILCVRLHRRSGGGVVHMLPETTGEAFLIPQFLKTG